MRMTYPKRLFGIYYEMPPFNSCCDYCLIGDCCIGKEQTAEILAVGTGAGDMAKIRIGGRIIDVPLTGIRFEREGRECE